jgi:hypothetical protein
MPPAAPEAAANPAEALWAKLKVLKGTYAGTMPDGSTVEYEYSLTGGGSALVEHMSMHDGMTSVYTLDGDRVMMTHYCGAKNQPRMASPGLVGDTATFDFVDATGMKSPDDPHMRKMVVKFLPDGSIQQDWSFYMNGKEQGVAHFDLKPADAKPAEGKSAEPRPSK